MTLVCNTWDAGLEQVYRMQPPQTTAGGHSNTCTLRLCLSVQLKELPQLARVNTKRNLPRSITTLANHTWTITPFNIFSQVSQNQLVTIVSPWDWRGGLR